jgi:hypothetical protein
VCRGGPVVEIADDENGGRFEDIAVKIDRLEMRLGGVAVQAAGWAMCMHVADKNSQRNNPVARKKQISRRII